MNFTGWIYIAGYWTTFILIGEWWHKKKGYSRAVGYLYPFLAAILSSICMFSPLSNFLNYMGPFFPRTSDMQWVMLIALSAVSAGMLALAFFKFWDGKVRDSFDARKDFPILFTFLGFPLANTVFCLIGGYTQILWLVVLAQILLILAWIGIRRMSRKAIR
ncbi:hypothetical protein [Saccharibacillus sp. O23]|uniref:hypothetical protein n=1 Tax=Saccharibacillus sp. O23 TaxID=2009338 RepID=UPI001C5271F3|nr:hypothetical protein [Saccharibacillus sp. O23]